ncbi:nucleotide-binding protein [bacterium]|nr:nucleotide-binding protein [bacterium]
MGSKASREEVESALKRSNLFASCKIEEQADKIIYKTESGFILNWWKSTHTFLCQGKNKKAIQNFSESISSGTDGPSSIFVVYGHDKEAKTELEVILRRGGLNPIILDQVASQGMTLVEKLETHLNPCDYVCVLLTPDDKGGLIDSSPSEYRPRARQNVIFELGWSMGHMNRNRVAIIRKESVDTPFENASDLQGIVELRYTKSIEEIKHDLGKELHTAGFNVDFTSL